MGVYVLVVRVEFGIRRLLVRPVLQVLPVHLAPPQAVPAQAVVPHQVETLHHRDGFWAGRLLAGDRVPVQVDLCPFAQLLEALGVAGESVVGEGDAAEVLHAADGGGQSFQLVQAQVERAELLQQADLVGERGQTVVCQVQNQKVLQTADGRRELLQLQKHTV